MQLWDYYCCILVYCRMRLFNNGDTSQDEVIKLLSSFLVMTFCMNKLPELSLIELEPDRFFDVFHGFLIIYLSPTNTLDLYINTLLLNASLSSLYNL